MDQLHPSQRKRSPFVESFTEAQLELDAVRRLLDLSGVAIARCAYDGKVLYATPNFAEMFSLGMSEIVNRYLQDLVSESSRNEVEDRLKAKPSASVNPLSFTVASTDTADFMKRADQPALFMTIRQVHLADTSVEMHVSVNRSPASTEQQSAQYKWPEPHYPPGLPSMPLNGRYVQDATVRELELATRFRAELSNSGAWVMDIASNTITWSESTYATLGIPIPPPGTPHTMAFEQWVHPDDLQRITEELYEPLMMPGKFYLNMRAIAGDGGTRYVRAIGETYRTREDLTAPDRGFGVFVDQTEPVLSARTLDMAVNIASLFTNAYDVERDVLPGLVTTLTDLGGFTYAAYHQRRKNLTSDVVAFSGSNRFMAREEQQRVQQVLADGTASYLTDNNNPKGTILAVFLPVNVVGKTEGVLALWCDEPGQFSSITMQYLENLAANLGRLIASLDVIDKSTDTLTNIATLFGAAIESHTPFDAGKHPRVAALSTAIAQHLGLPSTEVLGVRVAASIYDMGMLWIPDRITMAHPASLTEEDKTGVRRHTSIGESIASAFTWSWPLAEVMGQHHEHWDGSGYPRGIRGEEIALPARIVAVAAVYEYLVREQPYQAALSIEDAVASIAVRSGTHFDPKVVSAFESVVESGFLFPGQQRPGSLGPHAAKSRIGK